jgi:hypothetical protein
VSVVALVASSAAKATCAKPQAVPVRSVVSVTLAMGAVSEVVAIIPPPYHVPPFGASPSTW